MTPIESALVESLDQFLVYTRRRIADPDLAADTLQESLLKALRAAPNLRAQDRMLPWFYRILDNSIKDVYRRTARERGRKETLDEEPVDDTEAQDDAVICACLRALVPDLKVEYAEVLNLVDLGETDPDAAAVQLGISRTNLKVRRHRARQQLRARLEEMCRVCAEHGCLDCTCGERRAV